ncbi:hypothetical protein AB0C51_17680 [Streptomyces pathocidini]|uniref:hypothetical protein n=1 Tax=Streptomyces pathocidini TaxID=1650571 RepID=UPI0033FFA867
MTDTTSTEEVEYEYIVEDSALRRDCDLWFAVPAGFVEIPIGDLFVAPGTPEGARVVEAVGKLLELVPEQKQPEFLSQLVEARALAGTMLREGVVHVSIGAHEGDDGRMLESVLTITCKDVPFSPPKLAAVRAATSRQNAVPVAIVDLPCGPGAFTETVVEIPASADAQQRSVYEITAYLPYPNGRKLAVLTLTTTAVDAREHYRDIHRGIAKLVSFDNPLPEDIKTQIPESEVEASVRAVFG